MADRTDMAFKMMFDDLTKEDTVLKPDRGGMSREELIQEYKDRMGYIDEATAQMHHLTDFRPATKNDYKSVEIKQKIY